MNSHPDATNLPAISMTGTDLSTTEELTKTKIAARVLSGYENDVELDGRIPTLSKEISREDRRILQDRNQSLVASLRGCGLSMAGREKAGAAVTLMFRDGWPLYKMENPKQIIAAYVSALQEFPAWDVEAVCHALAKGMVEDLRPDYPPAAARVAQLCEAKIADMRREKMKFQRVLSISSVRAPPMTDEERERVYQRHQEWRQDRPVEVEGDSQAQKDAATARTLAHNEDLMLREYAAAKVTPVRGKDGRVMSLSLARMIGAHAQPTKAEMD